MFINNSSMDLFICGQCVFCPLNYMVRGLQNAVAFCDNSTAEKCYFVVAKRHFWFSKCEKCVL